MMINKRMEEKLLAGEAIDVSALPRAGRWYVLPEFIDGKDYCDARREEWIWSIGRRISDGRIFASLGSELYQNPEFECVWLR